MYADGNNLRRLPNRDAGDGSPSWSPDGTLIAFQSNQHIYVTYANGRNARWHTNSGGSPSWSPDGTQIAFQSNRDGNWEIYVLDLQWE
ncbi:MAG: hypothetical protein F4105_19720 [Gemmatimonadetes bacterium]|nr:hypothetical protein [Gemmatimonadota bacterium]